MLQVRVRSDFAPVLTDGFNTGDSAYEGTKSTYAPICGHI
jgi:hypothetical protein